MPSISWTDAFGAVVLTNGKAGPGGRFSGWEPLADFSGSSRQGPGMDAPAAFVLREHWGARLELPYIPAASIPALDRLKRHLLWGQGSCTITTDDAAARVYTPCFIWPKGGTVRWAFDATEQEYTLALEVALRSASPGPMLCVY